MVLRILYLAGLMYVVPLNLAAQVDSLNYGPEPIGGIAKLALQYFKIDFTKSQRNILEDTELELIFMVDEDGIGELEKVNGVSEPDIIDSLTLRSRDIARFHPQVIDGKRTPSVYFMSLQFPRYGASQQIQDNVSYKRPKLEDFESITFGSRWDLLIGGVYNQFVSRPATYLYPGGGVKMDLLFGGPKNFQAGMVMAIYGNKSKLDYPVTTPRPQDRAPSTVIIGLATNHRVWQQERKEFTLQPEVGYIAQNIMTKTSTSEEYAQLRGWSPGIIGNYTWQLGRGKVSTHYWEPVILTHHLNFHLALRYMALDLQEASGLMFELGVSYRMRYNFIKEYVLKEDF